MRMRLLVSICFFILLIGLLYILPLRQKEPDNNTENKFHPLLFYDHDLFFKGVDTSKNFQIDFSYKIAGGIVPHHLFPSYIITDFFSLLSKQEIETIILMGPNHYEKGGFPALSSYYKWQTPYGFVEPGDELIGDLEKNNLVKIDSNVLTHDHSIAGMMPFIKFYLPDVKVVPILLSGFMDLGQINSLSNKLKNYIDEKTVVISAVDFSHYLKSAKAQEKDKITLNLIKANDYKSLLKLNNEYLDSAPSIVALLMIMKSNNSDRFFVIHNTNSGILQNNNEIETTSYISAVFY